MAGHWWRGGGSGTATYAAPTVASSSSAAVDAGNLTVTKPSGTADGDLLVAITYADPDGSIVTPPSGWSWSAPTLRPPGGRRLHQDRGERAVVVDLHR